MVENNCCFTGHRFIKNEKNIYIRARLSEEIFKQIKRGKTGFICGGALGFDTMAAKMVLEFKRIFPGISLILYLPCKDQTKNWRKSDAKVFDDILKKADEIKYISNEYYSGCMHKRNLAMINSSSTCIAFLEKNSGGTYFTVKSALNRQKEVIYI